MHGATTEVRRGAARARLLAGRAISVSVRLVSRPDACWPCPLCGAHETRRYAVVGGRRYARCTACTLVSLDPAQRLPLHAEVARYDAHQNAGDDPRYAAFLRRLGAPLRRRLAPGARGLDFGCGPAPLLARQLTGAGFPTAAYDPVYHADHALLARRYDFVAASEVVEHLHAPGDVFALFARLLAGGGVLGVMTRFYGVEAPFERWWYRRDPTHVCFYAESTMRWIAERHGWALEIPCPHVALFAVPGA